MDEIGQLKNIIDSKKNNYHKVKQDFQKIENEALQKINSLEKKYMELLRKKYPVVYVIQQKSEAKHSPYCNARTNYGCFSTKEKAQQAIGTYVQYDTDHHSNYCEAKADASENVPDNLMLKMDQKPDNFPSDDYGY